MKNKEINKIVDDICKAIIIIGILLIIILMIKERSSKQSQTVTTCNLLEKEKVTDEWEDLINAIAFVESTNNPKAKNGQSVGLLQITPIYVAECNRILGEERYTLADREDSLKSIEMFNIYNSYYNENKDLEKAIKLHNPKAKKNYRNKIINQLKK